MFLMMLVCCGLPLLVTFAAGTAAGGWLRATGPRMIVAALVVGAVLWCLRACWPTSADGEKDSD